MSATQTQEGLRRVIGWKSLAANVVNITIGAGIFALPAVVAAELGAAAILGYLICGGLIALLILCYVEVGSRVTTSGGSYAYVETAFGPFAGFLVNALFVIGYGTLGDAAIINGVADSLAVIFPVLSQGLSRGLLFLLLIGGLAFFNVRGAKQGVRLAIFTTVGKLVPLLLLLAFSLPHVSSSNLKWHEVPFQNLGAASLVLFFAFGGFETALNASGEIENSKRSVPLGVLVGAFSVLLIYLLIQVAAQGVLGAQLPLTKEPRWLHWQHK